MIGPAPMRIAVLLLLAIAITFVVGSFFIGFWVEGIPGPGLLPFATAILLLPGLVVLGLARPLPSDELGFDRITLLALPVVCLYAVVVPYTGLAPGTAALVLIWTRLFQRQSWFRAALLAVVLVTLVSLLFKSLLAAPIPLFPGWL